MKKNVVCILLGIVALVGSIGYVNAYQESGLITLKLPTFGGKWYNVTDGVTKDSDDSKSTFSTMYSRTALHPQGILATNERDPRSKWTTLSQNKISYATNEVKTVKGKIYYSGAKSHNFESSDQTLVKYHFSPDTKK